MNSQKNTMILILMRMEILYKISNKNITFRKNIKHFSDINLTNKVCCVNIT